MSVVVQIAFGPISFCLECRYSSTGELQCRYSYTVEMAGDELGQAANSDA